MRVILVSYLNFESHLHHNRYHIAISNCCALLLYGQDDSVLLKAIRPQQADETVDSNTDNGESLPEYKLSKREEGACELFQGTSNVVFNRVGDLNVSHSWSSTTTYRSIYLGLLCG